MGPVTAASILITRIWVAAVPRQDSIRSHPLPLIRIQAIRRHLALLDVILVLPAFWGKNKNKLCIVVFVGNNWEGSLDLDWIWSNPRDLKTYFFHLKVVVFVWRLTSVGKKLWYRYIFFWFWENSSWVYQCIHSYKSFRVKNSSLSLIQHYQIHEHHSKINNMSLNISKVLRW